SALFRSDDGGSSWSLLAEPRTGDTVRSVQPDPRSFSRLFATTSTSQTGAATTRVYASEDSGIHWQQGLEVAGACGGNFAFLSLDAEPVYLLLQCSGRVFESPDHGTTWGERSSPTYQAFRIQGAHDGLLYATAYDGIYRSTDGAGSWSL